MYNPSRGGVRGGADQFTWDSVKSDKHRENYLGHSLMAPVGRWQKGKDLSWYAKERKEGSAQEARDRSELASVKRAEEEAMLIALGHNVVRKTQTLTKEDMREALKRNTDRDDHQIERIDGVGAASQRIASLSGVRKDARQNNEGVAFETVREKKNSKTDEKDTGVESVSKERKKNKKKSKKQKKDKKLKKHHKASHDSDSSDDSTKYRANYKKSGLVDGFTKSSKEKHSKNFKHRNKNSSDDSDSCDISDNRRSSELKKNKTSKSRSRDHDHSDLSDNDERKPKLYKKAKIRHQDFSYPNDSDSPASVDEYETKHKKRQLDSENRKLSKEKSHKKSKHKHYSSDDSGEKSYLDSRKRVHERHVKQKESVKRHRHDTSESD